MTAKTAHLQSRAVLALKGPDRFSFLQGLTSNDMNLAENGAPLFTCLLTPQGKFLFDIIAKTQADAVLLDCEAMRTDELVKRLLQFKLRADISTNPTSLMVYAIWGEENSYDHSFPDPRLKELGNLQITEKDIATNATETNYRNHRYSLGVAEGGAEINIGNATLLELNFDLLNGVSFTKGCYMGQELTARTHYRGLIKKRYFPFTFDGPAPSKNQIITHNNRELGEVMVISENQGLGIFNLEMTASLMNQGMRVNNGNTNYTIIIPSYLSSKLTPQIATH